MPKLRVPEDLPLYPDGVESKGLFIHIGHGEFVRADDVISAAVALDIEKGVLHVPGQRNRTCTLYTRTPDYFRDIRMPGKVDGYLPPADIMLEVSNAVIQLNQGIPYESKSEAETGQGDQEDHDSSPEAGP